LLTEEFSRAPMLWGIGRMAEVHPERLGEVVPYLLACLEDRDPQVRGLGAWALGKMKAPEAREPLQKLLGDEARVQLYDRGNLHSETVAQLAREALAALK